MPSTYTPKHGWAIELQEAKKAAKKAKSNTDDDNALQILAQFRVARAYHKLRQYKACRTACARCLVLKPHAAHKKLLAQYQADANAYLNQIPLLMFDNDVRKTHADFMAGRRDVNGVLSPHKVFQNSNRLQACAIFGDVVNMEISILYGAAIDFPLFKQEHLDQIYQMGGKERFGYLREVVPSDNTALAIVCALLANHQVNVADKLLTMNPVLQETINNMVECAVQLIMLGADLTRKLGLFPRNDDTDNLLITNLHQRKMDGKTVIEMVHRSSQPRLMKAIKLMYTDELKIANAHCRCGSRLRWRECHAGGTGNEDDYYTITFRGKLCFRYSPMAKCPCDLTEKPYFDCCWNNGRKIHCHDDSDSFKEPKMRDKTGERVLNMAEKLKIIGVDDEILSKYRGTGVSFSWVDSVKENWNMVTLQISEEERSKSLIDTYDREVYIGVSFDLTSNQVFAGF